MDTDNIYTTRRKKGQMLIRQCGSNVAFAEKIDRAVAMVSNCFGDVKKIKNVGHKMARHIEQCFEKPEGWMDTPLSVSEMAKEAGLNMPNRTHSVPLINWQDIGLYLDRKLTHKKGIAYSTDALPIGSFALRVSGDTMTAPTPGEISYPDGAIIFIKTVEQADKLPENLNRKPVIVKSGKLYHFGLLSVSYDQTVIKPINIQFPVRKLLPSDTIIGCVSGMYMQTK